MSTEFAKGFAALTTSFCGRSIADGLNGQLGVAAQQAAEEGRGATIVEYGAVVNPTP
jgi:hypothetical protein